MSMSAVTIGRCLSCWKIACAPAGEPFIEPTLVQSHNGVLHATLVLKEGPAMVGDTAVTNAWTYQLNGVPSYVGPTLQANPGDLLDIIIDNQLPEGQITNLHTHGLHVSPLGNSDNVLLEIEPGEENHYRVQIPADHAEGLYWYHPHHHTTVNTQIMMGLSGLLVIGDPAGGSALLDGLPRHLLALKNALIEGNELVVPAGMDQMASSQTFTVNGQLVPELNIPVGEYDVFNIANIGNNAIYQLAWFNPANSTTVPVMGAWTTIGRDGNPFAQSTQDTGLGTPAGRRWSAILTPPMSGGDAVAGTYLLTAFGPTNDGTNMWPFATLMKVNFVGSTISPAPPPPVAIGQQMNPPNQNFVDLAAPMSRSPRSAKSSSMRRATSSRSTTPSFPTTRRFSHGSTRSRSGG